MRILVVTHRYPPDGTAGVETYAARTVALLRARGHEVAVLTAVKDVARRDLAVARRVHHGAPVFEVTNNLFARSFDETWGHRALEQAVAPLVREFRPDVVHVHHLMYLSVGLLGMFEAAGAPVLLTLHDFWLGCARFGQLLHADGTRCDVVDPARCGTCLPSLPWRQSHAARRVAKAVAAIMRTTSIDVSPRLKLRHRKVLERSEWRPPEPSEAEEFEVLAAHRAGEIVDAVNENAARVLLPAKFQREWFEGLGLRAELMHVQPTGVDWERPNFAPERGADPGGRVRFLFLGTLVPHKGAHVLVDAWAALDRSLRERATLALFGPDDHRPDYVRDLRTRAERSGVEIGGKLDRDGVERALARADVLVVPSLWLEVRPLVMIEAYARGLRVLASDLGGMAEILAEGVPGGTFEVGEAGDLARALAAEIDRGPAAASPLPSPSAAFPEWESVAVSLERHSREIADGVDGVSPRDDLT